MSYFPKPFRLPKIRMPCSKNLSRLGLFVCVIYSDSVLSDKEEDRRWPRVGEKEMKLPRTGKRQRVSWSLNLPTELKEEKRSYRLISCSYHQQKKGRGKQGFLIHWFSEIQGVRTSLIAFFYYLLFFVTRRSRSWERIDPHSAVKEKGLGTCSTLMLSKHYSIHYERFTSTRKGKPRDS